MKERDLQEEAPNKATVAGQRKAMWVGWKAARDTAVQTAGLADEAPRREGQLGEHRTARQERKAD